jgi:hypothetical protein
MKEHIAKTIAWLEAKAAEILSALDCLRKLEGSAVPTMTALAAPNPTPALPDVAGERAVRKPKAKPGKRAVVPGTTLERCKAIARIAQPFGPAEVETAIGENRKTAGNFLQRARHEGWIKKTGFGGWERTAKFPGGEAAKPVTPSAGGSREELKRKLADALKQRDHARAHGRDAMVELFQKDIDTLEAQLGS